MPTRGRIKNFWRESRLYEQRTVATFVVIGALTLVLLARLVWLQVVRHDHYSGLAQGNQIRIEPQPAPRGVIYDRSGEILVDNQPAYRLELVPERVKNLDATLTNLARIGLLEENDLDEVKRSVRSRRGYESIPVRLRLDDEEMARFALNRYEFSGVEIRTRLARSYPYGEVAAHALGYVGSISTADLERIDRESYAGSATIGKIGIEAAYEAQLRGKNGRREIMVNARGRSVDKLGPLDAPLRVTEAEPGEDLYLTLDLPLQRLAEELVRDKRAAIVALDPNNGDVLAYVSRPAFDPNAFARGISRKEYAGLNENPDRPLFDRVLRGTYPPGSTIKPVVALAGMHHGIVKAEDSSLCVGFFSLPGSSHRFRDWKPQGHGRVDLIRSIADSCDTYYYSLAEKLGVRRLNQFLGAFGLGNQTGIDVQGERSGILPSPEWKRTAFRKRSEQVWFPGETVIFGIGQGYLTTTPLQIAQMTATLAGRGARFEPRLVRALRDPQTREVRELEPRPLPAVELGTDEQWQVMIDGMIAVMEGGTATASARGASYRIAGKTGTAQVFTVAQNQRYNESQIAERLRDHAWFVAFAPVEAPRIAVAVLVENGRSGSGTAAPIARAMMDAYLLGRFPGPTAASPSPSPSPSSAESE